MSHPTPRRAATSSPSTWASNMKSRSLLLVAALAACKDTNVADLSAPTSVANTPTGIQNVVTGLFFAARLDVGNYIFASSAFGRDAGNFTNTEPRWITEGLGLTPIAFNDFFWSQWE